jgi:alpha-tubulin suppressor-like RCC1 family protein
MRSSSCRSLLGATGLLFVVTALQACASSTDAIADPPSPAFSLTVGATTASLPQGGATAISIHVTKTGGLTSTVSYNVTGAPAGPTTAIVATSADSAILTITASTVLAPTNYTIVVNATSVGAPSQQASIVVSVGPHPVSTPTIAFVATGAHTCALSTSGAAYCWGYNANGELGSGDTSLVTRSPVAVAGGLAFQSLSISKVEGATCGLTSSGAAYCWGTNTQGQLGDGTTTRRRVPTAVVGGLSFQSLAMGSSHTCGIEMSGTAYCWGTSPNGAFGDGSVGTHVSPSVAAPGIIFESIVAGNDFTCGVTPNGAAYCWGLGPFGQLGNGSVTSSTVPVAVSGGLTFRGLVAGGSTVCGLANTGKAYCWGDSFFGTVGDGTSATTGSATRHVLPTAVAGDLTFQSISAGYQTMCGVTEVGAGYCWGYNFGAVGDGTSDHRSTPVAVAGGLTFRSIASGTGHSCGVTSTAAVYCWGDNSNGELGDGTTTTRTAPRLVSWR